MLGSLNFLGIAVATILVFGVGFLWYGPLFGKEWMRQAGLSEKDTRDPMWPHIVKGLVGTFLMMTVLAYILTLTGASSWQEGGLTAFFLGLGFIVPVLYSGVNWEKRPFRLFCINSLYWLIVLIIAGSTYILWPF